jgi:hypothetical protein
MHMSGKSTRKLMNLVGGNFFMPTPSPSSPIGGGGNGGGSGGATPSPSSRRGPASGR